MSNLKFPAPEQYPEGYNWFAYDVDGVAYFYSDKPEQPRDASDAWSAGATTLFREAREFSIDDLIKDWKSTLRRKGQNSEKPNYYTWIPGIECKQVTNHFNFNVGNIIKYCWRVGNPQATKHQSIEGLIEDLNKIKIYAEFEIQRLQKG